MAEQRQAGLVDHPEVIAHQRQKPFRLPHQISRLTIGDAAHPRLSGCSLARPGSEEGRPLAELRRYLRQQFPGAAGSAAPPWCRLTSAGQYRCGRAQGGEMCQRVTLPRLICSSSLNDSARGTAEQITCRSWHTWTRKRWRTRPRNLTPATDG